MQQVENGHGDVLSFSAAAGGSVHQVCESRPLCTAGSLLTCLTQISTPIALQTRDEQEKTLHFEIEGQIVTVAAGSSHFLIQTLFPHAVYSVGLDNRFGQLGRRSANPRDEICGRIEFFDGLQIKKVACGLLHSAVLDTNGGCYLFGSDAKGQCGGQASGIEPALVTLPSPSSTPEDEEMDVVDVACGSTHTVLLLDDGRVFVTGQSGLFLSNYLCLANRIKRILIDHHGQLGYDDFQPRLEFVEQPKMRGAKSVRCSRWATFAEGVDV